MNIVTLARTNRLTTVIKYFAVLTFICGVFTITLISTTLRTYDRLTIGRPEEQFLIPPDLELEDLSDNQLLDVFTKYINSFQILCRNHKRVGQLLDGGKEVCVDDAIKPRSPCLVYSFGRWKDEKTYVIVVTGKKKYRAEVKKDSNNQFDFEDKVIKHFGCEVLTFDPTMIELDRASMNIPTGCRFFEQGLYGTNIEEKKYYTMDTILKQFNHSERTIDLLKIDIEGSEWSALDQMMSTSILKNVRQLLVEFHFEDLTINEKIRNLGVFRRLHAFGFRAFSRERNAGRARFNQELGYSVAFFVEISFVNIRFL